MPTGTVKWFSDEKGFGFITPDEGSRDLFVAASNSHVQAFENVSKVSDPMADHLCRLCYGRRISHACPLRGQD